MSSEPGAAGHPAGPATGTAHDGAGALRAARRQRLRLHDALGGLEEALAAPLVGRVADWRAGVEPALAQVRDVLAAHITVTEGAGGLYAEILSDAPRLAQRVSRLGAEHLELSAMLDGLIAQVRDPACEPDRVREDATSLMGRLVRHRQRGADLVYEAYHVDIGGGE